MSMTEHRLICGLSFDHAPQPIVRGPRSSNRVSLTPFRPSAIVRASPLAHRQTTRPSHARRPTPLAELAVAFNPQVPPLAL